MGMAIWRCCRRLYRLAKVEGKRAWLKTVRLKRFGSRDLDQEIWITRLDVNWLEAMSLVIAMDHAAQPALDACKAMPVSLPISSFA